MIEFLLDVSVLMLENSVRALEHKYLPIDKFGGDINAKAARWPLKRSLPATLFVCLSAGQRQVSSRLSRQLLHLSKSQALSFHMRI